jgi:hypothetical protein
VEVSSLGAYAASSITVPLASRPGRGDRVAAPIGLLRQALNESQMIPMNQHVPGRALTKKSFIEIKKHLV